jgi:hypothetical protein
MAELQIPDYMTNRPASITDLAESMMRMKESGQNQRLNEMKMAEAQQLAPYKQRFMQSQAIENESTAGLNQSKTQLQQRNFAIQGAKQAVGYANKIAKEGTPEWEQAVLQAATPIAQALGHNDPSKPIDIPSLKALANMDAGGGEYHPPVATSEGYLQFDGGAFSPMLNAQGKPYMPSAADVSNKFDIGMAGSLSELVKQGVISLEQAQSILNNQVMGQPQPQPMQPQAQAQSPQARPQVHIDPNMSPEDQATAWDDYQKGVQYQGGGVPAQTGGIKSDTQRLAEKQAIENENKPLAEGEKSSLNFATRMVEANDNFNSIEGKYSPEKLNLAVYTQDTPVLGKGVNATLTPEEGSALQAKRQFINSVLRKESGAAIGIDEFKGADLQYFPQPGDSDKVIKQKEQARKTAIQGFLIGIPEKHHPKPAVIIENKIENKPQSSGKIKFIGFD